MRQKAVAVLGLGKLGSVLAAVFASKGIRVQGYDVNRDIVDSLKQDIPRVEPGLEYLLRENREHLYLTGDFSDAIAGTRMAFIVVPTPSTHEQPAFSTQFVKNALRNILRCLIERDNREYTIVLVSTVMPGTCLFELEPIIREMCHNTAVKPKLLYSPEFIALGDVVNGLTNPDFVLIGSSEGKDCEAAKDLSKLYRKIIPASKEIFVTNWTNAELAKLTVNTMIGFKINYANMLAELCEKLPWADVDEVTRAAGLDSRIGRKFFTGATGFGGPCLPRDLRALDNLLRTSEMSSSLTYISALWNEKQPLRIAEMMQKHLAPGSAVGVLGLSYRTGSNVVEESQAEKIAQRLLAAGYKINVYEETIPPGTEWAHSIWPQFKFFNCALACCDASQGLLLAKNDLQLIELPGECLNGRVIVDCWRLLRERAAYLESAIYVPIGVNLI